MVWRSCISESRIETNQVLITFNCQKSKQYQGGLNRTHQPDSLGISEYTNWKNCCWCGEKKEVSCKNVYSVCCMWEESESDTFLNPALFGYTKGLVLKNTTRRGNTRLSTSTFFSPGFRTTIYRSNCKNILWGLKCIAFKMSAYWGCLIKGPSGWQSVKMFTRRQNNGCCPMTIPHITYHCYFSIFSHKWKLQSFHNHGSTCRLFPLPQVKIHLERVKIWRHTGNKICWGTWR